MQLLVDNRSDCIKCSCNILIGRGSGSALYIGDKRFIR